MRDRKAFPSRIAGAACAVLCTLLPLVGTGAQIGTSARFLLSTQLRDLPSYFPAYLGNAFYSTHLLRTSA